MSFKKRKSRVIYSVSSPIVDEVVTDSYGNRQMVSLSPQEYFTKHPPIMEEYTLSEELNAGVPLKEINCSHLLEDEHAINTFEQDETLLSQLEDNNHSANDSVE